LPSPELVVALICYFFSYSTFYVQCPCVWQMTDWLDKMTDRLHKFFHPNHASNGWHTDLQVINNPPHFPQVYCSFPASTSGVHLRGRLFKVCCRFCGSLTWQLWFVTAVLLIEQ
jgi:hypothetical protein